MHANTRRFNELSHKIIGASYEVANTLGRGFVEKVYRNALFFELQRSGVEAEAEFPIKVFYKGEKVGDFYADLLVENCIIIEIKANSGINNIHLSQSLNYLKATNKKLCLLINFGTSSVQVKRVVNNFL